MSEKEEHSLCSLKECLESPIKNIRRRKKRSIFLVSSTLTATLLGVTFIYLSSYSLFRVSGDSMSPTLNETDIVFVQEANFVPERGKLLLVKTDSGVRLVKRVAGVGGNSLTLKNSRVVEVDGEPVKDPFFEKGGFSGKVDVPKGYVYLLGDNRGASTDSRELGVFDMEHVEGLVVETKSLGFITIWVGAMVVSGLTSLGYFVGWVIRRSNRTNKTRRRVPAPVVRLG